MLQEKEMDWKMKKDWKNSRNASKMFRNK